MSGFCAIAIISQSLDKTFMFCGMLLIYRRFLMHKMFGGFFLLRAVITSLEFTGF